MGKGLGIRGHARGYGYGQGGAEVSVCREMMCAGKCRKRIILYAPDLRSHHLALAGW